VGRALPGCITVCRSGARVCGGGAGAGVRAVGSRGDGRNDSVQRSADRFALRAVSVGSGA